MNLPRSVSDPKPFFSTPGAGREMLFFRKGRVIFAQGDVSDAVFVIQTGRVKLSARSQRAGAEATFDILGDEDFIGDCSIAGQLVRTASATALTDCQLLRIEKKAMTTALEREPELAKCFYNHVLARNIRYQEDLVDQRCNCSEKRLARILSLLAGFDKHGSTIADIPEINQGTLAEIVGTTRSRVSLFMNRFRQSGFVDYKSGSRMIRVHRTILVFYLSR